MVKKGSKVRETELERSLARHPKYAPLRIRLRANPAPEMLCHQAKQYQLQATVLPAHFMCRWHLYSTEVHPNCD
jgi:hypothetical protein